MLVFETHSDKAGFAFCADGAKNRGFVKMVLEIISRAWDFQADDEGSIPFNRSSLPVVDLLCRQRSSARILAPNHNG
jgi:hypothetical protein